MEQSNGHPQNKRLGDLVNRPTPWGLKDIILALIVLVVAAVVLVFPAAALADIIAGDLAVDRDPEALAVILGANLGVEVALLGAAYVFSVAKYKLSWKALGFRRPRRGGVWLPVIVLGLAWAIIGVYLGVVETVGPEVLIPSGSTIPDAAFESAIVLPIAIILTIVFAPLMEEVFFRGFVFGALRSRFGIVIGALASGFLFSALHFDVATIIPFMAIGVLLSLAYAYSGSLLTAIAAHAMFNGVSVIATIA